MPIKGGDTLDFQKGGNLRKGGVDLERGGMTPLINYAKKLIYRNFKQYFGQFKMDIFKRMSSMRTHAAFENSFVSILDQHAPKKIKHFTRE